MVKILKKSENVVVIEGSVDVFIVPNHATTYSKKVEYAPHSAERLIEVFGELDPNDQLVQVWMVGKNDFVCDNMQDHCPHIQLDGEDWMLSNLPSYIPEKVLRGKTEGERIAVTYPAVKLWRNNAEVREEKKAILTLDCSLNQKDYRYRRFGNFEDVLESVCN